MKKYKLIKWYPSVGNHLVVGDIVEKRLGNITYMKGNFIIAPSEVENNPEFWQEIVEHSEGTIIESIYPKCLRVKKTNGKWQITDEFTNIDETEIGENGKYRIVEQEVKKPLFITEDGVDIIPKQNGEFQYWSLKLDNWKISNAPHILNSNKINPTPTEDLLRCCNELRFSTKEAAEEYINLKKPYLSNKDVLDEINKCTNIQQLIKVFTNKAAK